jgi:hypothetical protein
MGLVAFSKDGEKLWTYEQRGRPRPPVVDAEGTAYAVFNERDFGRVIAVTATGELEWLFYTATADSLAMGEDGALYVAAGKRVYALEQCAHPPCLDDGSAAPASNPEAKAWTPDDSRVSAPTRVKPKPPSRERHEGYDVYPQCRPGVTAIVRDEGEDFPWYEGSSDVGPAKSSAIRTEFRGRALSAIPLRSHSNGFGVSCVEPRGAFVVWVFPGQDVPAAARAVGQWLKRENLRGEIDIREVDLPTTW